MKPAYVDSRRRQADSEQETFFPIICIQKPHETEKQKFWNVIWYLKILNYSGFFTKIQPIRLHDLGHVIKINQWESENFDYF